MEFVALAKSDFELREKIRAARNDGEIIDIAASLGFQINSMTLLRQWSKHKDFTKPTWLGWFE